LPQYRIDPFPDEAEFDQLWRRAWCAPPARPFAPILQRSLGHLGAFERDRLIAFVNIAWDGGIHAFILDLCTDPDFQRRGIGSELMRRAIALANDRGAKWLHVDFEPHLEVFYRACGFRPSAAGIMNLG
jgi:GNAT superfamily N-acetyltransferase